MHDVHYSLVHCSKSKHLPGQVVMMLLCGTQVLGRSRTERIAKASEHFSSSLVSVLVLRDLRLSCHKKEAVLTFSQPCALTSLLRGQQ